MTRDMILDPLHKKGDVKPLMKCGHSANGYDAKTGNPVCIICSMITPDAEIVVEERPSLEGRKAKCGYGDKIVDSDYNLPFFEYRPDRKYDSYYCGCFGWS